MSSISQFEKYLLNEIKKDVHILRKDMPGVELLKKAQRIIALDGRDPSIYNDKPYYVTTQNQRYLDKTVSEGTNSACIILGAGNTLFELVSKGISDITALEINELQVLVYKLCRACIVTLSAKDYDKFIIDHNSNWFLDKGIFNTVEAGFDDESALNCWHQLIEINPKDDLKKHFFKGIEAFDVNRVRYALPYLKKRISYYELRDRLEKVKIKIVIDDLFNYLLNHPELKFDYIDITNILLFVYQLQCNCDILKFQEKIKDLIKIFNQNLNQNGTMVLDYHFATSIEDIEDIIKNEKSTHDTPATEIYPIIYKTLKENFELESFSIEKVLNNSNNPSDTVLFSRKKSK